MQLLQTILSAQCLLSGMKYHTGPTPKMTVKLSKLISMYSQWCYLVTVPITNSNTRMDVCVAYMYQ